MPKGIISALFQRLGKNEVFYLKDTSPVFGKDKSNAQCKSYSSKAGENVPERANWQLSGSKLAFYSGIS